MCECVCVFVCVCVNVFVCVFKSVPVLVCVCVCVYVVCVCVTVAGNWIGSVGRYCLSCERYLIRTGQTENHECERKWCLVGALNESCEEDFSTMQTG